jgi:hypothetical protein
MIIRETKNRFNALLTVNGVRKQNLLVLYAILLLKLKFLWPYEVFYDTSCLKSCFKNVSGSPCPYLRDSILAFHNEVISTFELPLFIYNDLNDNTKYLIQLLNFFFQIVTNDFSLN